MRRAGIVMAMLFASALASSAALAGPFGINKGQSVAGITEKQGGAPHYYIVRVPAPNPEFDFYQAYATPKTGICRISGLGKTHADDQYGTATRAVFDKLRELLSAKYGQPKDYDFLRPGALWKDPDEWVMAVKQKERTYSTFWTPSANVRLPDGIEGIKLEVNALSSSSSYISLSYEFDNFDSCQAVTDAQASDGL